MLSVLFLFYTLSLSSVKISAFVPKYSITIHSRLSMSPSYIPNDAVTKASSLPTLPIPPPILSLTPGTWAYDTMSRRVDKEILERTYQENKAEFDSAPFVDILQRYNQLRTELQSAETTLLRHLESPTHEVEKNDPERIREMNEWRHILDPFIKAKDTWLSAPWLVTEFYLYRRLLEALGYFTPDSPGYLYDPFEKQKRAGLLSSVSSANYVLEKVESLQSLASTDEFFLKGLNLVVALSLWGNKMDLSLWPADMNSASVGVFAKILDSASDNLLHDDTPIVTDILKNLRDRGDGHVDIIVDNAGFELVMDLVLADYLIATKVAKIVTFQLKAHPTFVSDAMTKDLMETVEYYAALDKNSFTFANKAGKRWEGYLQQGCWKCNQDYFWVLGSPMWHMPLPLHQDLNQRCDIAIVKGDANYRRLLGDRTWDFSAPFEDIVGAYFPCPIVALRTLKAELGCGMSQEQVKRAKSLDANWLVNGRFGVVHYGSGLKR